MRLFLIRHGQTAWNVERLAQGHSDIPLDATGREQAAVLARAFHDRKIPLVYSSDLLRCVDTASPLAEAVGARLWVTPELRERGFGELEGEPYEVIRDRVRGSGLASHEFTPPGGESMVAVQRRLANWAQQLTFEHDSMAIVSHGGSCSLLLAHFLGQSPEESRSYRFSNTGITELMRNDDGRFTIVRYDDTQHLYAQSKDDAFGVIG